MEIKVNKKQEIVAYRQRIYKGQYEGHVDGPYHVADIYSYTKINLDELMELTDDTQEKQLMESTSEKRVRSKTLAGDAERGVLDRKVVMVSQPDHRRNVRPLTLCQQTLDHVAKSS